MTALLGIKPHPHQMEGHLMKGVMLILSIKMVLLLVVMIDKLNSLIANKEE